jgi:hypothetical protein
MKTKLGPILTTGLVITAVGLVTAAQSGSSTPDPAPPPPGSGAGGGPSTGPGGAGGGTGGRPPTSSASTGSGSDPEGPYMPPGTSPVGPGDKVEPWPFARREEVQSWAADGNDSNRRHERLMALARAGALDPIRWVWVPVRRGLEVQVSSDAVAYSGIRLCCSLYTAQQVADVLGVMLCTPAILRAAHRAARTVIPAQSSLFLQNPGGNVAAWLRHQDAIMRAAKAQNWNGADLISSVSKDYFLSEYVLMKPHNSPIYLWVHPQAELSGPPGEMVRAIQSPRSGGGSIHGPPGDDGLRFFDYSHGVRVVNAIARLDGREVQLADIYRDRSDLVSHMGNVETIPTRHPEVPLASAGGA